MNTKLCLVLCFHLKLHTLQSESFTSWTGKEGDETDQTHLWRKQEEGGQGSMEEAKGGDHSFNRDCCV